MGPYGLGMILTKTSKTISILNKGVVTDYALYILIGICFYLAVFTFFSTFFDIIYCISISCLFSLITLKFWIDSSIDLSYKNEMKVGLVSG